MPDRTVATTTRAPLGVRTGRTACLGRRGRLATATHIASVALVGLLASGCNQFGGPSVATEDLTAPCPKDALRTANTMGVQSPQVNVRTGPGTSHARVIDQRRSHEGQPTEHVTLNSQVTVLEECRKDGWSRVWVTEPEQLRATHHGWVASRFLTPLAASASKRRGKSAAGSS